MVSNQNQFNDLVEKKYDAGFVTDIEQDTAPVGLDESTIHLISTKKDEPQWMLEWRLKAYQRFLQMKEPSWAHVDYPPIDLQSISYYAAPKTDADRPKSLDEIDPKLLETYEKLGIPLEEQKMLAGQYS